MRVGRQPLTSIGRTGRMLRHGGSVRTALISLAAILLLSAPVAAQTLGQLPGTSTIDVNAKPKSSFGNTKGGPFGGTPKKIDKASPLLLEGDELIYDTRGNRVIARGNVQIYYDDYVLTADEVVYDQGSNTLTANGNAQLKEPNGNIVRADKLITTDNFRDAFVQSLSVVGKDDSRIAARRAVRKDGNISEFEDGKFTPCKNDPGKPPLWCVSGKRIVHDQQAGTISYQDATFDIFGVPVLYMPYFTHADPSTKRQTGFLIPELGYNDQLGYTSHIPYYFALSPNYDFLAHPKYMSKHGVLWQGDWRHKVAFGGVRGEYTVKLAGIDQDGSTLPDDMAPDRRNSLDGWRGSIQTQGQFSLSSWWKFGWDITLESDDTFRRFYKLDNILQTDRVNTVYLEGISDRNYFSAKFYHFGGLLIEDTSQSESRVHPVIDYNYVVGQPVLGGELSFNANALSLSRTNGTDITRVSMDAQWRKKIVDPLGQVWTPFAYAKADVSHFTNGFDPDVGLSISEDTITRAIGAGGITYAYPFVAHTGAGNHVVEPIAQVVARTNSVSQRRLPDEDARSLVWDDTLLFDTDKFSGWDRIETGTRANVGAQYTFQSRGGGYARFIAGQSFHLAGDNAYEDPGFIRDPKTNLLVANFSPRSGLDTKSSDYVVGAYLAPTTSFKLVSQARFDETELSLRRANIYSNFNFGPVSLHGQYSYTRDDPLLNLLQSEQELLGGATLKLTDTWSIGALARYDLDARFMLQEQFIVKYTDECFVLTATYTENHITNPTLDLKPDRSLMLRFELKYLGDFHYKTDSLDYLFGENQPTK